MAAYIWLCLSLCALAYGYEDNGHGWEQSDALLPSISSRILPMSTGTRSQETTTQLGTPFLFSATKSAKSKDSLRKHKKYHAPTQYLTYLGTANMTLTADGAIKPTRKATVVEEAVIMRHKRCFTCGPMDGSMGGDMGSNMGGFDSSGNRNLIGSQDQSFNRVIVQQPVQQFQQVGSDQNFNRVVIQPAQVQQVQVQNQQQQQQLLIQGADGQLTTLGAGAYTFPGDMQTTFINGYAYTLSSYTKIIDGRPTVGIVTLVPMHTYFNNKLLQPGENAYGVPAQGTYTLAGSQSMFQSQGYPYTVSSFTRIVDGQATFGAVTLAGMQTFFNNRLLAPNENPYGVPNQGVYTLPGNVQTVYVSGYPMTISSYTKIVDGVATFGTATVGGMQTYFAGKLLAPGENPYGVPNQGTYTLPGPVSQFNDENGYPLTVSSYTKIVNGRATFGALTQGMKATYYNGKVLRYGENPYGVPNQGTYTLGGNVNRLLVNGQEQTLSTYTRIVNGQATYGTVTQMQMQTVFVPNGQQFSGGGNRVLIPAGAVLDNGMSGSFGSSSSGSSFGSGGNRVLIPANAVLDNGMGGNFGSSSGTQQVFINRVAIPMKVTQQQNNNGNFGQFSCALMGK